MILFQIHFFCHYAKWPRKVYDLMNYSSIFFTFFNMPKKIKFQFALVTQLSVINSFCTERGGFTFLKKVFNWVFLTSSWYLHIGLNTQEGLILSNKQIQLIAYVCNSALSQMAGLGISLPNSYGFFSQAFTVWCNVTTRCGNVSGENGWSRFFARITWP